MKSNVLIALGLLMLGAALTWQFVEHFSNSSVRQVEIAFDDSVKLDELKVGENRLLARMTNHSNQVIRLVGNNAC